MNVLATGRDILYRFDDERRLRELACPDVLEAMRQEIHLTLHVRELRQGLRVPALLPGG